jgi:GT2 family glycosyltransferase
MKIRSIDQTPLVLVFGDLVDASAKGDSFPTPDNVVLPAPVAQRSADKPSIDSKLLDFLLRFPLFDVKFYIDENQDADFRDANPIAHYFETPVGLRASPHPLFDRSLYRANHPHLDMDRDEFLDYLEHGDREGRAPHVLFDPLYYRERNLDLATDQQLTLLHFVTRGYREGRDPHPLFATAWYLSQYPEAAELGNPLLHYLSIGAKQRCWPHPLFDPAWYLSQTQAAEALENPLAHYLTTGSGAGLSPHPLFDPGWYLRTQVDPDEFVKEPLSYFLTRGISLGHDPNPLFSTKWYLQNNPDVSEAGMEGIIHYLIYGAAEHRDPHPAFATSLYLQAHSDSAAARTNPLIDALERDRPGRGGTTRSVAVVPNLPGSSVGLPPKSEKETAAIPIERRLVAEVIAAHSSEACAKRVIAYFNIIERFELGHATSTLTREEKLEHLAAHMRDLLAEKGEIKTPEVTVIIPSYNHVEYTIACVISLLEHATKLHYEIIIGNNISTDETRAVFEALGGIVTCITHEVNGGFITNCNISSTHVRGKYMVLLNNDTLIVDGWLDELIAPFERFNNIGLVGSKLLMGDGRLQEAGGIIWKDGSGWNFGRNADALAPEFNYVKDVDYVSGASIALPTAVWRDIGGMDERYLPAYYDDSDLAFEVRARGLRTLYAPASTLIHHEGITHGTDTSTGIKAYQVENQKKFASKWAKVLAAENFDSGENVFLARDRSRSRPHILVIDHYVPQFDRDAGSRLIFEHCKMFVDAGFKVIFWPDNLFFDKAYVKALQDLGVEVIYGGRYINKFPEWIAEAGPHLHYAFLSRSHISGKYVDLIKGCSNAKILFCGHDLNVWALEKEYKLTKNPELLKEIDYWNKANRRMWKASDVIYYPAIEERDLVAKEMPDKLSRLMCVYIYPDEDLELMKERIERSVAQDDFTISFVAGFRHRPNADAAKWLVREILPRVRAKITNVSCFIIGSYPPPDVMALEGDGVVVTGYVPDAVLHRIYKTTTVVVAPLRFGGGIKGKILEGLRFGVPIVTTPSGAEGMPDSSTFLEVGETADEFSDKIIQLLKNPKRRQKLALNGIKFLQKGYSYSVAVRDIGRDVPEVLALLKGKMVLKRHAGHS